MDSIAAPTTGRDRRKSLETLPEKLDITYANAMDRIRSQSEPMRWLAEQILGWLSFASRPIKLTELQHALAVEVGESQFVEDNLLNDDDDMTSCCAGLVVVEPTDKVIRLVHYTTQEYF